MVKNLIHNKIKLKNLEILFSKQLFSKDTKVNKKIRTKPAIEKFFASFS